MTIRHLKIFITVAKYEKMRKAAEELYITQPTISQAIKELEDYYSCKLFERLPKRLFLTEHGKLLLDYARHVIDSFDAMELAMKNASAFPKLRVGSSASVGACLLNNLILTLEQDLPQIDVSVCINNTSAIETMISNNELDVAIVEGIARSSEILKLPIYKDEMVAVVGKTHPFYSLPIIELEQLNGEALISREQGSAERNHFEQLLEDNNISMEKKWSCTNTEAIKAAVISGRGIALMSRMVVQKECEKGYLKVVPVKNIKVEREIKLIYHKNKYLSAPLKHFIELCENLNRPCS